MTGREEGGPAPLFRGIMNVSGAPNYRFSPSCFNCKHYVPRGFLGREGDCRLHPEVKYLDKEYEGMPMNMCMCDDWSGKQ